MDRRSFLKQSLMAGVGGFILTKLPFLDKLEAKNTINNIMQNEEQLAKYWENINDTTVRCLLCPNYCVIQEGQVGICKDRKNIDGKLYSLSYGRIVAINIDPIEKKPLYHFLPMSTILSFGTAGCNFSCKNCQNWDIAQASPLSVPSNSYTPAQLIKAALAQNIRSIAFTYNEPTVFYEFMYETALLAKNNGIKTVLVSNGYINPQPLADMLPYLDAANIDLKSFDDNIYIKLNGGKLQPVLNTLKTLKDNGIWLEITNLIVPTYTDDLNMIENMVKWLIDNGFADVPLHFSRFFPAYKLSNLPPTPVETIMAAAKIARDNGIKYVYTGNVLDEKNNSTFCPQCGSLLIKRQGYHTSIIGIDKEGKCTKCGYTIAGVWS
jgi:pyruvate formate lyase activating enzyme